MQEQRKIRERQIEEENKKKGIAVNDYDIGDPSDWKRGVAK